MRSLAGFLLDMLRAAGATLDAIVVAAQDWLPDDEEAS